MTEDKLQSHRSAEVAGKESRDRFYSWLNNNCVKAVSHDEVRKIMSDIKEPIQDILRKQIEE